MKPIHILPVILTVTIICCRTTKQTQTTASYNLEAKDHNGNPMLLGKCTRERLAQAPFDAWFVKNYNAYMVDSTTARQLQPLLTNKRFVIFMGTWCGDSRREVPRIYKLLDHCGVQAAQVQLINVSNSDSAYKQSPGHEEKGLNIHHVPDLLVYEKDRELGRIIETPVTSWEKDLLAICSHQPYEPHYKGVTVSSMLQQRKR